MKCINYKSIKDSANMTVLIVKRNYKSIPGRLNQIEVHLENKND